MSFTEPNPWVESDVICDRFGITLQTLGRWVAERGLPCRQINRRGKRYFKIAEVDAWLDQYSGPADDRVA